MSLLRRKESLVLCSPIPAFIPRKLAIDVLHSHGEVITLNPLVVNHKPIPVPANASGDEQLSTWYEITEKISFVPGLGSIGSGTFSFNGCFDDIPAGLLTHIYAPAGVDLRVKYTIAGEPPGPQNKRSQDIGLLAAGAPAHGLWLQCDIWFECNLTLVSFVRSQLKTAIKEMVDRIVRKAEILDADELQQMIQNDYARAFDESDSTEQSPQSSQAASIGQQADQSLVATPQMSYRPYKELQKTEARSSRYSTYKPYRQAVSASSQQREVNPYALSRPRSELPAFENEHWQNQQHYNQIPMHAAELPGEDRLLYSTYTAQPADGFPDSSSTMISSQSSRYDSPSQNVIDHDFGSELSQQNLTTGNAPPSAFLTPTSVWESPDSLEIYKLRHNARNPNLKPE